MFSLIESLMKQEHLHLTQILPKIGKPKIGRRQIIQEELLAVLTMMVGANISPEQLLSIAERTILEADEDKDELISFEEFVKVQLL